MVLETKKMIKISERNERKKLIYQNTKYPELIFIIEFYVLANILSLQKSSKLMYRSLYGFSNIYVLIYNA